MTKPIYSISPFTLLDYSDKTACILWFAGCNMRCVYCYNPKIVLGKGKFTLDEALKFIDSRKNLLDGVVLSGGECTSHKGLEPFLQQLKERGLLVKVDTNGSNPEVLKKWLQEKLINYVALDYKSHPEKYKEVTQSDLYVAFETSLKLLIKSDLPFEVRTTLHSELLFQEDIQQMVTYLEKNMYSGTYYLQDFRNETETLGNVQSSENKYVCIDKLTTRLKISLRN